MTIISLRNSKLTSLEYKICSLPWLSCIDIEWFQFQHEKWLVLNETFIGELRFLLDPKFLGKRIILQEPSQVFLHIKIFRRPEAQSKYIWWLNVWVEIVWLLRQTDSINKKTHKFTCQPPWCEQWRNEDLLPHYLQLTVLSRHQKV